MFMPAIPIKIKAKRKIMHKVIFFMGPVYNGNCTRRPIAASTSTEWIEIGHPLWAMSETEKFLYKNSWSM